MNVQNVAALELKTTWFFAGSIDQKYSDGVWLLEHTIFGEGKGNHFSSQSLFLQMFLESQGSWLSTYLIVSVVCCNLLLSLPVSKKSSTKLI